MEDEPPRFPSALVHRDLVLLGLTMVAACTDAISYLGLGEVFPANMTGNTVLLGLGLATGDVGGTMRSATALGTFVLGAAAIGAAVPGRVTARVFRIVVAIEFLLLGSVCAWWNLAGTAGGDMRYGLIGLAGATMGAQSGLMRCVGTSVSTTYITGTWTALSENVATAVRRRVRGEPPEQEQSHAPRAIVVLAYLGSAYGAALAFTKIGAVATAVPLGLLAIVAVAAGRGLP